MSTTNQEEQAYLDLMSRVLQNGRFEEGRNGHTHSLFGETLRFSLKDGRVPILTTKKMALKTCLKEMIFFISGDTDAKTLQKQGVHIWDGNSSREFLDSRGLQHFPEGTLGAIYGRQWRRFNAPYNPNAPSELPPAGEGVDQLQQIIDALRDPAQRNSRRLILTAWNPLQSDQMALLPCHVLCQFNVHDGNKLSCAMFQRSVDLFLGAPFNICSYAALTHLLAHHCGLVAHELVYFMGNVHVYAGHEEACRTQIARASEAYSFPTLRIGCAIRDQIEDYTVDDFVVEGYQHHPTIAAKMVA